MQEQFGPYLCSSVKFAKMKEQQIFDVAFFTPWWMKSDDRYQPGIDSRIAQVVNEAECVIIIVSSFLLILLDIQVNYLRQFFWETNYFCIFGWRFVQPAI